MNVKDALKFGLRPCIVKGHIEAFFHGWENFNKPIGESMLRGGHPAGMISITLGIVENAHSGHVFRCEVCDIRFVDDFEKFEKSKG